MWPSRYDHRRSLRQRCVLAQPSGCGGELEDQAYAWSSRCAASLQERLRVRFRDVGRRPWVEIKGQASRPISTGQLHALPRFHTQPINLVVFEGPLGNKFQGGLILKGASRLDAFSGYPVRMWLPGGAAGATTGTPVMRSSRSSRTKDNSPQTSCAHSR